MINRGLTNREREILEMIRPTTFQDIVDIVRRDVEKSRYNAKRELRNLHNGAINGITDDIDNKTTKGNIGKINEKDRTDNISNDVCGMLT